MRNVYISIVVFLVACIIASEVYIRQMKGPGFFDAPAIDQTLWIIEWLLMLVAVCIIGIAIGHYMQEKTVAEREKHIAFLIRQQEDFKMKDRHRLLELDQLQKKLTKAQQSFSDDFKTWSREKERLKEELASWQSHTEDAKKRYTLLKDKIDLQQQEWEKAQRDLQKLEQRLEETMAEKDGLQTKLSRSFTLPQKDDLKLINGIGPAIEKKLNALGIYSFRQISEFTSRTIDEVSSAIKFFPGRIERDNWVSQARNLEEEKRRQAQ